MIVHRLTVVGQDDMVAPLSNLINAPHRFFPLTRLVRTTVTFSLFPTTSLFASARVTHETQEPVMGFVGRLEKHPHVRAKQGKEARKVSKGRMAVTDGAKIPTLPKLA